MSVRVVVSRPPGDKPSPESVIDPLLDNVPAAQERGRQLLNESDSDRMEEAGTIIGTDYIQNGVIVQIKNSHEDFRSMVTNFTLDITGSPFMISSAIRAERVVK